MITIIVPIWNAAKTIIPCVESIQAQTYSNWELILSDDGSLDDSLKVCQELAAEDSRIHVIVNQHSGVANTRNVALDAAKGNYICYVDADDTIDPDYLETLLAHRNYDMVVSGYWVDIHNQEGALKKQERHVQPEKSYDFSHKEEMKDLFASGMMHINCNKLLHKNIIDQFHLRYKPYPVNEDFIFMMEYLLHCKNLYVIEKATYHWIRVENNRSGVESIPDNLLGIYNEAHVLTRKFFSDNTIADEILYFSYELIAIKYIRAIKQKILSKKEGKHKLTTFIDNSLVKDAFKANKPATKGAYLSRFLLKNKFFSFYSYISIKN